MGWAGACRHKGVPGVGNAPLHTPGSLQEASLWLSVKHEWVLSVFVVGRVIWSLRNRGAVNLGAANGFAFDWRTSPIPTFFWEQLMVNAHPRAPLQPGLLHPGLRAALCAFLCDSAPS